MKIAQTIVNLIFPPLCLNCRRGLHEGAICAGCLAKIELRRTLFCGKCGARLADGVKICHKEWPYVLGAATAYDGAAKNMIRELKFGLVRGAAEPLGRLVAEYARRTGYDFGGFAVLSMPLPPERMRKRGFNQAELVARAFAQELGLTLLVGVLERPRNAKPQSETASAEERRRNAEGAFRAADGAPQKVILVDDVSTSGATLYHAASALKKAGAKQIVAMVAAKAD